MIVTGRINLAGEDYIYWFSTKWQGRERFTVPLLKNQITKIFKARAYRLKVAFDESSIRWSTEETQPQ